MKEIDGWMDGERGVFACVCACRPEEERPAARNAPDPIMAREWRVRDPNGGCDYFCEC